LIADRCLAKSSLHGRSAASVERNGAAYCTRLGFASLRHVRHAGSSPGVIARPPRRKMSLRRRAATGHQAAAPQQVAELPSSTDDLLLAQLECAGYRIAAASSNRLELRPAFR
jgi:hypothetical protein